MTIGAGPSALWNPAADDVGFTLAQKALQSNNAYGSELTFASAAVQLGATIDPGRYEIDLYCADSTTIYGVYTGYLWFLDATHYTTDANDHTIPTEVTVVLSPAVAVELGKTITLTATVDNANASGKVQFSARLPSGVTMALGGALTVSQQQVTLPLESLDWGLYYLSATFTPDDTATYKSSTTATETPFAITLPVPPTPPTGVTMRGVPKVGQEVTCSSDSFDGATSYGFQWYLDLVPIDGATTANYTPVDTDAHHLLACQVLGTKTVNAVDLTSGRLSASVEVAAG